MPDIATHLRRPAIPQQRTTPIELRLQQVQGCSGPLDAQAETALVVDFPGPLGRDTMQAARRFKRRVVHVRTESLLVAPL